MADVFTADEFLLIARTCEHAAAETQRLVAEGGLRAVGYFDDTETLREIARRSRDRYLQERGYLRACDPQERRKAGA